jgi:hypothetical protein
LIKGNWRQKGGRSSFHSAAASGVTRFYQSGYFPEPYSALPILTHHRQTSGQLLPQKTTMRINSVRIFFVLGSLALLLNGQPSLGENPLVQQGAVDQERDGQHDFDFVIGSWKIHNRRLRDPLTGSTTWVEFEGTSVARKIWGGRANVDEGELDDPSGHIQGMTLRLYDPTTRLWSLYWATSKQGTLAIPTIGRFANGRGEFYDYEVYQGKAVLVRFLWLNIKPDSCRWEQAFSSDGGKTWETNWTMDFERISGSQAG